MPALKVSYRPVADLIPYARNSRTHSEAQIAQIAASVREFGWTNPVLIDEEKGIIAGHGRVLAARKLAQDKVPCIVLAGLTAAQKRAYVIADNKLALNAGWDEESLKLELSELDGDGFDIGLLGFDAEELDDLGVRGGGLLTEYTSKIEAPIYAPKGEKPAVEALFDRTKLDELLAKIDAAADIGEPERAFLRMSANRHVVFDYHQIAEFYCHAPAELQALMEDSALVIIDFKKAIEGGFVKLSRQLQVIFDDSELIQDIES